MAASLHAYVCMLQWLGCVTGFIYGLVKRDDIPWLWYTSLIGIVAMPIFNELFLNLKARLCRNRVRRPDPEHLSKLSECIPIVYSKGYNIHAFGAERLHPFDASKYRRVFAELCESETIQLDKMQVHAPCIPSREFLQHVMSPWYLFQLNYSWKIFKCIELPVFILPAWVMRMRLLDPMQRSTQGSVDAACIAH